MFYALMGVKVPKAPSLIAHLRLAGVPNDADPG